MKRLKVQDVRNEFIRLKETNTWSKNTLEIQSVSFEADEPSIFGKINEKYVEAVKRGDRLYVVELRVT